jgi:hypothetical protein
MQRTMVSFAVLIVLAANLAGADTLLIRYKSGKVQTIRLDEPSSSIAGISYHEQDTPSSGSIEVKPPEPAIEKKTATTPETAGKPQVRMEWAAPVE